MSHPGGNRARFFPAQNSGTISPASLQGNATNAASHTNDTSVVTTFEATTTASDSGADPNASNGPVAPFSTRNLLVDTLNASRPASDSSTDEIIAQRTRMIETETLFKAKKERSGRLNVSGLIRYKDSEAKTPNATIKEVLEHEELDARSPRPYSAQKLISKLDPPSPPTPQFSPPTNHLLSTKLPPSRQPTQRDSPPADTFRNKQTPPITPRSDSTYSHISPLLANGSSENKLKGLTTAFNRKHSAGASKPTHRFKSPTQSIANVGGRRVPSPPTSFEEDSRVDQLESVAAMRTRHQRNKRHDVDMECDEDEYYQMVARHDAAIQESGSHRDSRGEKRASGSGAEGIYALAGKRARTEAYGEVHNRASRFLHD